MRRAVLLLALAGCGGRGVVEVDVTMRGFAVAVDHFDVTVVNGGQTATVTVPLPGGPRDLDDGAKESFALAFDKSRSGSADITVDAIDALLGDKVATGRGTAAIDPGGNTSVAITIVGGGELPDGGSDDGGTDDGGPPGKTPGLMLAADALISDGTGTARYLWGFANLPSTGKPQYDSFSGFYGCAADYFDASLGKGPPGDLDAGNLTISGYTGGHVFSGAPVPDHASCARVPQNGVSIYVCAYGDLDGSGMPNLGAQLLGTPLDPTGPVIQPNDAVTLAATGGADVPPWSNTFHAPLNTFMVEENLTTLHYDAGSEMVLHVSCPADPGASCGADIALVVVVFTAANGGPATSSITCAAAASDGKIVIAQGAVSTALGTTPMTFSRSVTTVFRVGQPVIVTGTNGQPAVALAVGRGTGCASPQ